MLLALSVRTPPGGPAASSEAEAECSRSWNGALYPYYPEFARASRCRCPYQQGSARSACDTPLLFSNPATRKPESAPDIGAGKETGAGTITSAD